MDFGWLWSVAADAAAFAVQWLRRQPPLGLIGVAIVLLVAFKIMRFRRRRRRTADALPRTGPTRGFDLPAETGEALKEQLRARLAEAPVVLAGPVIPEGRPVGATFDVDAAAAEAMDARAMVGDSSEWTNLSTFRGHGGKLIFLHGVSDPWFSAKETVRYYELLGRDNAEEPLAGWSRLFLVPGMGHCGGGARTLDRFDMLSAVVDWVESGRAPERVVATGVSAPGESRPLCPYPAHAQFGGNGDAHLESNYTCRE